MNFITGKHLSRRTFLRGTGASVALPFMDAMVPAGRVWRDPAEGFTRLICLEEDLGHAGGQEWGDAQHLFGPAKVGRDFEFVDYPFAILHHCTVSRCTPFFPCPTAISG